MLDVLKCLKLETAYYVTVTSEAIHGQMKYMVGLVVAAIWLPKKLVTTKTHKNFTWTKVHSVPGRPVDSSKQQIFDKLCLWLETNDSDLLTLQDVVHMAQSLHVDSDEVYSEKWIKRKLIDRYGDHIQFNEIRGRRNVICWRDMATYILNQKWHDDQKCSESEHVVVAAAKVLRAAIRDAPYKMDMYPYCSDVQDAQRAKDWTPQLLRVFTEHLIASDEKQTALGQCIVQSVRPRTVTAPIPLALGVSVDHESSSKFLINLLYRLGLSFSYEEISRYKQSVVQSEQTAPFESCFRKLESKENKIQANTLQNIQLYIEDNTAVTRMC